MSQEDDAAQVLDGGLDDADVHQVEEHGEDVSGRVRNLEGLNLLPVVALEKLKRSSLNLKTTVGRFCGLPMRILSIHSNVDSLSNRR